MKDYRKELELNFFYLVLLFPFIFLFVHFNYHLREQRRKDLSTLVTGNIKLEERVLVVDTQPPFLKIISPEPSSTVKHAVTIKWEVADELSGVIKVEIGLDGRPWIDVTGRESYAFAELPAGNHTVRLKATDGAGNTVVVIVPFNVGVTSIAPPAPSVALSLTVWLPAGSSAKA